MEPHLTAAQQYFPTYKLDPSRQEIGLREYDLSGKALESDQKSLTAATGIALFFAGTAATLIGSGRTVQSIKDLNNFLGYSVEIYLYLLIIVISAISVYYFSCLQKSATYAARKIIILRRLLGLDYGNIKMVLPSDRLEGANEPFSLPMFPGWLSLQALPVVAVAALSAFAQATVFAVFYAIRSEEMASLEGSALASSGVLGWFIASITAGLLLAIYRYSLFEDFENIRLRVAKGIAILLWSPINHRIGHVLYRMKLSVFEAKRVGIVLESFHDILISIEDKRYYRHNGNSLRSIAGAVYRFIKYKKASGGSTIYQQLSRSNFITTFDKPLRRKIIEWMLAPWLCKIFTRKEGLNVYLCSVRFAKNVVGLPAAILHYFPDRNTLHPITTAERFFLIERLSNVTATYPAFRIAQLVDQLEAAGLLTSSDRSELNSIYTALGAADKIDLKGQIPSL